MGTVYHFFTRTTNCCMAMTRGLFVVTWLQYIAFTSLSSPRGLVSMVFIVYNRIYETGIRLYASWPGLETGFPGG